MDVTLDNINDVGYYLLLSQILNVTQYEVENGMLDCIFDDDDDDLDFDFD